MSGTITGGKKVADKLLAKDPDYYKKIGSKGGKLGTTGGFYANRELARKAGAKGGAASKPYSVNPKYIDDDPTPPKKRGLFRWLTAK